MNIRSFFLSTLFFLVTLSALQAQGSSSSLEDKVRELLVAMGSGNQIAQVLEPLVASMKQITPDVPDEFWDEFVASVRTDELIELIVPIYTENFTEEEIDAM